MLHHSKSGIVVKGISLFQPHNDYTDTEGGWQMEMSYIQADQTLVFMVWIESIIIMVIPLSQPHNVYTITEK